LEKIVIYALVDKPSLQILYLYYALGMRPSDISRIFNVSKWKIKGSIERVSKSNHNDVRNFLIKYYDLLIRLPTVYEVRYRKVGAVKVERYVCKLCGKVFKKFPTLKTHLMMSHKQYLNEVVKKLDGGVS
jgi:hypothetical protein